MVRQMLTGHIKPPSMFSSRIVSLSMLEYIITPCGVCGRFESLSNEKERIAPLLLSLLIVLCPCPILAPLPLVDRHTTDASGAPFGPYGFSAAAVAFCCDSSYPISHRRSGRCCRLHRSQRDFAPAGLLNHPSFRTLERSLRNDGMGNCTGP